VKAEGLTPLQILQQPQRLMIPLFQRPYVWGKEAQWEPLWDDIIRMAEALRPNLNNPPKPHFLGAIVLQQRNVSIQSVPHRWVIDGQQRLTTLQIIIDAVQACMEKNGLTTPAGRLKNLIENEDDYRQETDDIFKLWPTNRDRDAYREVMGAAPPIDYANLKHKGERIVEAHKYFSNAAQEYILGEEMSQKANALEIALKQLLKIVVIDLDADEDAQEIFETLNSRGVKLSAADLIKNFIFQRLEDEGADSDSAYEKYWKRFETAFWETEITSGRLKQPRTAVFLNQFLIARTGDVVTASEVFSKFKDYAINCGIKTVELLKAMHDLAEVYELHVSNSQSTNNEIGPIDLFLYRTQAMDVEVIKSLVIYLLDPALPKIDEQRVVKALTHVESWLVRRSIMRATSKGFNRFIAQMISDLLARERSESDVAIESYLASQTAESTYWPDDDQIREQLKDFRIYRSIPRSRTRMILEALEDHARGYTRNRAGIAEQRCTRDSLTIEHVMPQSWEANWPVDDGELPEERTRVIQYLGNLTLLTSKLNSRVSNGPWHGTEGKRAAIHAQSSLILNAVIENDYGDDWTVSSIKRRNADLIERLIEIWPTPIGHKSLSAPEDVTQVTYVSILDLVSAGLLEIGDSLTSTWSAHTGRTATVRSDGTLEIDTGEVFDSLSGAARRVIGSRTAAGWHFWKQLSTNRQLTEIRDEYRMRYNLITEDEEEESE
jgi:hypothetical protein